MSFSVFGEDGQIKFDFSNTLWIFNELLYVLSCFLPIAIVLSITVFCGVFFSYRSNLFLLLFKTPSICQRTVPDLSIRLFFFPNWKAVKSRILHDITVTRLSKKEHVTTKTRVSLFGKNLQMPQCLTNHHWVVQMWGRGIFRRKKYVPNRPQLISLIISLYNAPSFV